MANIDEKMKVKRMRYFNSLFLTEEEFNLEQNYNIRMRRLHNRHLHSWGIVWGLDVVDEGDNKVKIIRGMALNKAEGTKTEGNDGEDISQEVVLTEDTILVLESKDINSGVYIYLDFEKVDNYVLEERGGTEKIHWLEEAVIGHSTDIDQINEDGGLVLAKVQKDESDNNSIKYFDGDTSLRTYAGAFGNLTLPIEKETPDETSDQPRIEGRKIEGQDGIQISSQITKFSGAQTDQPTSLSIEGGLHVGGTADPGDNNLIVDGNCSIGGTVEATEYFGDGSNLTGISPSQWTDFPPLGISYLENVGIGTKPTEDKLTVQGVVRAKEIIVGGLTVHEAVSAKEFFGDGSNLTGITPGQWTDVTNVGIYYKENVGIGSKPSTTDKLSVSGLVRAKEIIVGGLTVHEAVSAKEFFGDGSLLKGIIPRIYDVPLLQQTIYGSAVPLATIKVGTLPIGIAFGGEYIWVTNYLGESVSIIDRYNNTVLPPVKVGLKPYGIAFDGRYMWVTNSGSEDLSKIDIIDKKEVLPRPLSGIKNPMDIVYDGKYIWVTTQNETISKIDITTNKLVWGTTIDGGVQGIAFDGKYIWVANPKNSSVIKIDISNNAIGKGIDVGKSPYGIAFDSMNIWVANLEGHTVSKIDINTDKVVATIKVGLNPTHIAFDGRYIWVTNQSDQTVSKIDINTDTVVATIIVGGSPYGSAFDGRHIWVTNFSESNSVTKI